MDTLSIIHTSSCTDQRLIPTAVDKLHSHNHFITNCSSTKKRKMADLIASTIGVLLEKAVSVTANRIGLVLGFYKDLEELRGYAKDIQAVLADAETKQSQNPIVLRWLQKVEGVALEASYILDELLYESLRRQVKSRNKSNGAKVCLFFTLSKHDISFRWRMGSKVRNINAKLKMFNMEAMDRIGLIRIADSLVPTTVVQIAKSRQTDSLALNFVAGRANEIHDIVEMLLGSSEGSVSVLPIVGMGGIGKTTVAKSVYNDETINGHFSKKGWFCVSEQFEVIKTLRGILESLKGGSVELCGRDALVQQIQKELNGERFLFVLDDVWNEDNTLWVDFYDSLVAINKANGSCCIVTTRLQTTANYVSTVRPFVLGNLQDDDCWSILSQRATRGGDIPEELKVHKNQILRRCQGLPLAAITIGCLLSRENWLSIVEDQILKVNVVIGEIAPILKLSFDNLPSPSIKKCFAYCSIYMKDSEIDGKELVELWMAEGFIQEDAEGILMEKVGSEYLTILLQSSLLERRPDLKYYKMHDLVHDLAESISKQEQFDMEKNHHVQHLTLNKYYRRWNTSSSLIGIVKGNISAKCLSKYKYLHVLNLIGAVQNLDDPTVKSLARSISKMKHLRHLTIDVMPEALCKLYNLQTLKLDRSFVKLLPQGLSNLISLRHLFYEKPLGEIEMPPNMGRLTCLQTLTFFNVGKGKGCGIEELGLMNNLEGKLEISNLQLVEGKEGALLANLCGKQNLEKLILRWGHSHDNVMDGDEDVLEGLEPQPNLRKLSIYGFMGSRLPSWWGKLSSLVSLLLIKCSKYTKLPAMGHLPYLKNLHLSGLDNVVCIADSHYNDEDCRVIFPSLKSLYLSGMGNLREWKELQVKAVNDLDHCGQSSRAPICFPCLEVLVIFDDAEVSVVKSIIDRSASSLKNLTLHSIRGMTSLSDVITCHLPSLEKILLWSCNGLSDIPSSTFEGCKSLKELWVESCILVDSCPLDFHHIPLTRISLVGCPFLFTTDARPRGFNHFTNLRSLAIGPFGGDSLQLFDWSGLSRSSTIKTLELTGSYEKHSSLPQQLQHLTSLVELKLMDFELVEGFPDWLGNLTSLKTLHLCDFPKLEHLPSANGLTNLRTLRLDNCPLLKRSWDLERDDPSSEWSRISRLPNLCLEN